MSRSNCFLCGDKIRRQLGFNPVSLNHDTKKILSALRKSWTTSLCTLLDIQTEKCRVSLNSVPYCLSCHQTICDVEFMMRTITRLEGKLYEVKKEVKQLLRQSYRKSDSTNRQLIEEILSPAKRAHVKEDKELLQVSNHEMEIQLQELTHHHGDITTNQDRDFPGNDHYDDPWTLDEDITQSTSRSVSVKKSKVKPVPPKGQGQRSSDNGIKKTKRIHRKSGTGYMCTVCQEIIQGNRNAMTRHKRSHEKDFQRVPSCQFCGKRYNNSEEVKDHEILHKPTQGASNPFFCVFCTAELTSTCDLQQHVLAEHETGNIFKCDMCPAIRISAVKLRDHKKRSHLIGVKTRIQCPHCPFQAIFPSVLKYHIKTHGQKNFKCDIGNCVTAYHNKNNLVAHKRKAHGIDAKQFPCTLCTRIFNSSNQLKAHQVHHSTLRPFMCEMCPATFKSARNLNTHRKVHSKVSGTNIKLQKPRKARLSDMRLQNETEKSNFDEHPMVFGIMEQNQMGNYGNADQVLSNNLINS